MTLTVEDDRFWGAAALGGSVGAAEAYMDGTLTFEDGDTIRDFIELFSLNRNTLYGSRWQRVFQRLLRWARWLHQFNPVTRSASNARHHYDLGEPFYRLFLDNDMNYSCAYFRNPEREADRRQARSGAGYAYCGNRLGLGLAGDPPGAEP